MKLVTLFAGAGGLDLGFTQAGFTSIWANEYDKDIWETYERNHPHTFLDKRSITEIEPDEVPDCDGIIGGPPCQSWSEAGSLRGIEDPRGRLFLNFIKILKAKQPLFFLAENVAGMLLPRHQEALTNIQNMFRDCGYVLSVQLLNAVNFGVPQDRKRIFFVGYRNDLKITPNLPNGDALIQRKNLRDAISDLTVEALPARENDQTNGKDCALPNHEYMTGSFSSMYMSRNRVRAWDEPSFTIQAGGRHAPCHPRAPKMEFVEQDIRRFVPGQEFLYRRLSIRECARIQTFPNDFIFYYKKLAMGYKMVGNAVPVRMAKTLAMAIRQELTRHDEVGLSTIPEDL